MTYQYIFLSKELFRILDCDGTCSIEVQRDFASTMLILSNNF